MHQPRTGLEAAHLANSGSIVVDADRAGVCMAEHLQSKTGPAGDVEHALSRRELGRKPIPTAMLAPQLRGRVVGQMLFGGHHPVAYTGALSPWAGVRVAC